jgi:hypothetical protein
MAKKNKEIREMYHMPHLAGSRSFAHIEHDIVSYFQHIFN